MGGYVNLSIQASYNKQQQRITVPLFMSLNYSETESSKGVGCLSKKRVLASSREDYYLGQRIGNCLRLRIDTHCPKKTTFKQQVRTFIRMVVKPNLNTSII